MNESNLRLDLERAAHAQRILNDDLVVEALSVIRQNITYKWENSGAADGEGREEAWKMLKALNEFERHLRSTLETGKMAEAELTRIEKLKKHARKLFA